MSIKIKSALEMAKPVPPWTPKNIVRLTKYLGISQARLTKEMGISYSALRAWIDGRSKSISPKLLVKLRRFERKIPALRKAAEEKYKLLLEKEERRKGRLSKPWPVARIRSFMHTWGMTQVEFAVFANVSYDTVTSWSRGRRRLVRKETAEHIAAGEELAKARGFPKGSYEKTYNPWAKIREFATKKLSDQIFQELPKKLLGDFDICAIESDPGQYRVGKKGEKVTITAIGKKGDIEVTLHVNKKMLTFPGIWKTLGGIRTLELITDKEDPNFLSAKAGCLIPTKTVLKISLWGKKGIPIRLLAVKSVEQ